MCRVGVVAAFALAAALCAVTAARDASARRQVRSQLVYCDVGSLANATSLVLSSSGRQLLFGWTYPASLRLVSVSGRGQITTLVRAPDFVGGGPRPIAWSPDEEHLVYSGADGTVAIVNLASGTTTQLAGGDIPFVPYARPQFLGWFPDSEHLLMSFSGQVYVADLSGRDTNDIATTGDTGTAVVSPDGNEVVFSDPAGGVSIARVDGSGTVRLAADGRPVAWSPDAAALLYLGSDGHFHVVDTDGGADRRLPQVWLDGEVRASAVAWTPNGIYYNVVDYATRPVATRTALVSDPYDAPPRPIAPDAAANGYGTLIDAVSGDGKIVVYELVGKNGRRLLDRSTGVDRSLLPCFGTRRADRLFGSPLGDYIDAKGGNDVIDVRGDGVDAVICGAGRDTVYADRTDRIDHSCERIVRSRIG